MRTIIPCTLAELRRMAAYTGPGMEFYIKEITTLDKWRRGVPHLPHNRVWCGLNSFNMPGDFAEPGTVLSLQGAGDLLILSQFMRDADIGEVTCYEDRAGIFGTSPSHGVIRVTRSSSTPGDMLLGQLRHRYSYVTNHPAAVQFLMKDAMEEGWDHYDWFGLMLGIAPGEKWVHVNWEKEFVPHVPSPMHPVVAVHAKASTADRSVQNLVEALGDITHIVLGGGHMSYHQTYRVLQQVDAVIAVDSVILHMAAVARPDLPVLGVYTSTPTTWAGPRREGVDTMQIDKSSNSWYKEVLSWTRRHT